MTPADLLGASEAAARLGMHRTTFWLQRKQGRLPVEPVVTIGNRPLFDRAEIERVKRELGAAS